MKKILFCFALLGSLSLNNSFAASTTFRLGPSDFSSLQSTTVSSTALQMRCLDFLETTGITNATKITITSGNGITHSGTWGVGFYNKDGTTLIRKATITPPSAAWTAVSATGLTAFSLSANTSYRFCFCSSASAGTYGGTAIIGTAEDEFRDIGGIIRAGTAANPCTGSADLPATTGVLTIPSDNVPDVPFYMIATDTP